MIRVLVVEDEPDLASAIAISLRREGYAVDVAGDGASALDRVGANEYDLVCLDLNLPDTDGLEVCRQVVSMPTADDAVVPRIIMLTARGGIDDRISGLDQGADDYLVKPFSLGELGARVRAVLRRDTATTSSVVRRAGIELDSSRHEVRVNGTRVELTTKEFALLRWFVLHPDVVHSSERLLEHVWDEHADPFTNTVRVTISNLRRKLAAAGGGGLIETLPGRGYLLRSAADERSRSPVPGAHVLHAADRRTGVAHHGGTGHVARPTTRSPPWSVGAARVGRDVALVVVAQQGAGDVAAQARARRAPVDARRVGLTVVPAMAVAWFASGRMLRTVDRALAEVDAKETAKEEERRRRLDEVIHELRTPLAVAGTNLELAASDPAIDPDTGRLIDAARRAADRMRRTVDDLAEHGRLAVTRADVLDLAAEARAVVAEHAGPARARGLHLQVGGASVVGWPAGDRGRGAHRARQPHVERSPPGAEWLVDRRVVRRARRLGLGGRHRRGPRACRCASTSGSSSAVGVAGTIAIATARLIRRSAGWG